MKKLLIFVLIVIGGVLIWFAFGMWTGIYSIYSYPPSKEHAEGATLIISRDPGEPMFNSPQYVPPKATPVPGEGVMTFEPTKRLRRPVELRTIVKLPYIEWAYKKSLEPQEAD